MQLTSLPKLSHELKPSVTADSLLDELFADDPIDDPNEPIDPAIWIEREFWIPENNGAIILMPYQRAVLREAYRRDDSGQFIYSTVLWSDIKKSGKSSIAAAVALERAGRMAWGSVKVVANDLKQADSRVSFYARRAIELNPALRNTVKIKPSGYTITMPNHAIIEAIPVDPKGEAGGNDDLIIFSELWAANQKAALRMWSEMTLSPTKYGQSQRWVETYAGFSGESPLLEQLYQSGVKEGRQLDLGIDGLEVYANDASRLLCLWNTIPRCDWQTPEYYAQEAAVLTPEEFARVHRNQWSSSSEKFIPIEWWDGCQVDLPPIGEYQSMVVALDAATTNDTFGIVAVTRSGEDIQVRYARRWIPPVGGKLDFSNPADPNDINTPEGYVRWLIRTHSVVEVTYDAYQLHDMMSRLRREGIGYFREFNQGADRLVADKQLYDLIRDRRIQHDGSHHDLREHLQNANRKDSDGDKLRIIKRAESQKIDLAVCAAMASYEARRLNIG